MAYRNLSFAVMLVSASVIAVGVSHPQTKKAVPASRESLSAEVRKLVSATPFQNNDGSVPPPGMTQFTLSHDWPTASLPPIADAPWRKAIGNGPITTGNAQAYAEALKAAVADNGRALITQGSGFDAKGAGWYNEP